MNTDAITPPAILLNTLEDAKFDADALLAKYKTGKPLVHQSIAMADGREIIGCEADDDNQLLYVIKNMDDTIVIEYAANQDVVRTNSTPSIQITRNIISSTDNVQA